MRTTLRTQLKGSAHFCAGCAKKILVGGAVVVVFPPVVFPPVELFPLVVLFPPVVDDVDPVVDDVVSLVAVSEN